MIRVIQERFASTWRFAAAGALMAALAAGCDRLEGRDAGSPPASDEPAGRAAAALVSEPTPEHLVLRRGNLAEPLSLDPIRASVYPEYMIVGDMFTGLFTVNAFGQPVPSLALGWRVSEDGLTWTFRLREASWSDGAPVTADDFVYGMRRVLDPESGSPFAPLLFIIEGAEAVRGGADPAALGVRAVGPDQLEITLNYAAPYLPGVLAHYSMLPAPRHVIEAKGEAWTAPEHIVVNGAYRLWEWTPGEHVIVKKNPRFFDAANVCFEEVVYYPIDSFDVAEQMFRDGELDVNVDVPGHQIETLRAALPDQVEVSPGQATSFIAFNTRAAPFDDVKVRQALAMLVDPVAIAREVARSSQIPATTMVPPSTANYAPGASAPWAGLGMAARRAQALALLEEAGFGPSAPLTIRYDHLDSRDNPRLARHLEAVWEELGDWVSVETAAAPTNEHYPKLMAGEFQVADANWLPDYNDPYGYLSSYLSSSGDVNLSGWSHEAYDALIARSNQQLDFARRATLLQQAEAVLLEQSPVAPVWHLANASLVAPDITGWRENTTEINRSQYLCRAQPRDGQAGGDAPIARASQG